MQIALTFLRNGPDFSYSFTRLNNKHFQSVIESVKVTSIECTLNRNQMSQKQRTNFLTESYKQQEWYLTLIPWRCLDTGYTTKQVDGHSSCQCLGPGGLWLGPAKSRIHTNMTYFLEVKVRNYIFHNNFVICHWK